MQVTKIGHCCLHITLDGLTILTDPGRFSTAQDSLTGIHVVLITHEHADHVHVESLVKIFVNNPSLEVITNSAVANILKDTGIPVTVVEGRDAILRQGIRIEAYDGKHEEIFNDFGQVQNTGYMIGDILFYPGDSFHNPERSVDVLALPIAGPWCRMADALNYALAIQPRIAFPVHDGTVADVALPVFYGLPEKILSEAGISFVSLKSGDSTEI